MAVNDGDDDANGVPGHADFDGGGSRTR